jgi:hypothetical protein
VDTDACSGLALSYARPPTRPPPQGVTLTRIPCVWVCGYSRRFCPRLDMDLALASARAVRLADLGTFARTLPADAHAAPDWAVGGVVVDKAVLATAYAPRRRANPPSQRLTPPPNRAGRRAATRTCGGSWPTWPATWPPRWSLARRAARTSRCRWVTSWCCAGPRCSSRSRCRARIPHARGHTPAYHGTGAFGQRNQGVSLSVRKADGVRLVGQARDYVRCRGQVAATGAPCTAAVNR